MPERLGDRYGAFVDLAVQQAVQRGLTHAAAVARFVNLWFVWGPAFHDKPGFEWAQGLLAAPAAREWVTVHQLVQRSLLELQRLPGARIEPQTLVDADARVQATFGPLGRQGAMSPLLRAREPEPLPRKACDLEAADVRVLDDGWHHEYRLQGGDWQRVPVPMPAPLRIDAARTCPPLVAVLSQQRGPRAAGPAAAARARATRGATATCTRRSTSAGPHGLWRWVGHETRAVSWPVATREQPLPAAGPGSSIGRRDDARAAQAGHRDLRPARRRRPAGPAEDRWSRPGRPRSGGWSCSVRCRPRRRCCPGRAPGPAAPRAAASNATARRRTARR